jgi:hypothetical protein
MAATVLPILLVACSAAVAGAETAVPLPVLPPPHVRYPGLFDERGCALLENAGAPSTVCPAPRPVASAAETRMRTQGWRTLLGYDGPYFATSVSGAGVAVIPESVGIASADAWCAVGLLRNDTMSVVTDLTVVAQLVGKDGALLATGTARVPVHDVRPGEPAPFAIDTTAPRAAVADVRWRVLSRPARPAAAAARMVEIKLVRSLMLGGLREHEPTPSGACHQLPSSRETRREVAWGFLKSWSGRAIRRPSLVGMWLDDRGRGAALLTGLVLRRHGSGVARSALRRGASAQFVILEPDRLPDENAPQQRIAFWASAS